MGLVCASPMTPESELTFDITQVLKLEYLVGQLFRLHNLSADGSLSEAELIELNEKIAELHHGKSVDIGAVRQKYRKIFRTKLDPLGRPVQFPRFRIYVFELLSELDSDLMAQEMIVEGLIQEASLGRTRCNVKFSTDESSLSQ